MWPWITRGCQRRASCPVKINSIYIDSELCHHNIMLCVVCFVGYRITSDFKTVKLIGQQGAHLCQTQKLCSTCSTDVLMSHTILYN